MSERFRDPETSLHSEISYLNEQLSLQKEVIERLINVLKLPHVNARCVNKCEACEALSFAKEKLG